MTAPVSEQAPRDARERLLRRLHPALGRASETLRGRAGDHARLARRDPAAGGRPAAAGFRARAVAIPAGCPTAGPPTDAARGLLEVRGG